MFFHFYLSYMQNKTDNASNAITFFISELPFPLCTSSPRQNLGKHQFRQCPHHHWCNFSYPPYLDRRNRSISTGETALFRLPKPLYFDRRNRPISTDETALFRPTKPPDFDRRNL